MTGNCPECNSQVDIVKDADWESNGIINYFPVTPLPGPLVKYKVPFMCTKCGSLNFPYQALRDIIFLYPVPELGNPEKIGHIVIPESIRNVKESEYAIVLSAGKEYIAKKGKRFSVEVVAGDLVIYDKQVPWVQFVKGSDGKQKRTRFCSYADILAIIKE